MSYLGTFIYKPRWFVHVVESHRRFATEFALAILVLLIVVPLPSNVVVERADGAGVPQLASSEDIARITVGIDNASTGLTLIAPYNQKKVYLVDYEGETVHTWVSTRATSGTVKLLPDGTLLRGRAGAMGQGDGVQILDWDGTVLWDYTPPSPYQFHHDIEPMPNGNFLLNAVVSYTSTELINMGKDPNITPMHPLVEPIFEVKPNGTNDGDIVWVWNPVDHIIQDYDASKPNYGVVSDHPELIDLNYPRDNPLEWQHSNAVAYNAELDQVMITDRNFGEFWVIDHNTTTAVAARHTGGAQGKGGDLLYRWGNPRTYGAGDVDDQLLGGPHDAHWVAPGLPGAGNIIVFNNGVQMAVNNSEERYSSVEELVPPVNATGGYPLDPGASYGPAASKWRYNASPPQDFFAWSMGGVERLPNGNTLVCGGSTGYNFEVEPSGDVVWRYRSSQIFRVSRYYPPYLDKVPYIEATEDVVRKVDISAFLSDLDTDVKDLLIDVDSPYINVSGHELILLYPDGVTTDVINVTVGDGIFQVGRDVHVDIIPVNDPPVLVYVPEINATEDVPYDLPLAQLVMDPDDPIDELTFTVDSAYVTVLEGTLRFLYPNGVLSDVVHLTVSDGFFEDSTEISIRVTPVNDPPSVDPIMDQSGTEDVPWTINLWSHVEDVDDTLGNISVASDSPYVSISGMKVTFLYPDGITFDQVHLEVNDGKDSTVITVNVTIEPVNDPPWFDTVPPVTVTEDEPFALDLGPAIHDIDTPTDDLVLRVDSPYIEIEGQTLSILYPDGIGHDEVVVEVTDGELRSTVTLMITVEPVDDPPVINDLATVTVTEDEPLRLDLGPELYDIDTPLQDLTLHVDSPYIEVDGQTLILLYVDDLGTDEVVIEVSDGELMSLTTISVIVLPVNDPPWWSALPEVTATEDTDGELDLAPFLNDDDTAPEDLVVEVDSSYGSMDGHTFRFRYPNGILSEQVTLTLSDGEFQAVLRTVITVIPVNDAPELLEVTVDPATGRAGKPIRFTVVFRDVDMGSGDPVVLVVIDDIAYKCSRAGTDDVPYSEGVVFFLETKLTPGTHTFQFETDDGGGGAAATEAQQVVVKGSDGDNAWLDPLAVLAVSIALCIVVLVAWLLVSKRRLG